MFWPSVPPRSSQTAPAFELIDLNGPPVRTADFHGRSVVVNFFATWCAACVFELPLLEAVAVEYAGCGVVVLLVDVQQSRDTVAPFVNALGVQRARVALDLDGAVFLGQNPSRFTDRSSEAPDHYAAVTSRFEESDGRRRPSTRDGHSEPTKECTTPESKTRKRVPGVLTQPRPVYPTP